MTILIVWELFSLFKINLSKEFKKADNFLIRLNDWGVLLIEIYFSFEQNVVKNIIVKIIASEFNSNEVIYLLP